MAIKDNQRPGVYSRYDMTAGYTAPRSERYAALAGRCSGAAAGRLHVLGSPGEARAAFAEEEDAVLLGCALLLLEAGVTRVLAAGAQEDGDLAEALALLEPEENIGILVCAEGGREALGLALESAERSCEALRERVVFGGAAPGGAAELAESLNHERMVLCTPAVAAAAGGDAHPAFAACALAGRVLTAGDPAHNWSGEALPGIGEPERLEEEAVQALLRAGVTVLEPRGGAVECVRALTTRTATEGAPDLSLRSLNTVLIIDDVIAGVRGCLKERLRGLRSTEQSMESIRSQVAVELAARQDEGLIAGFEAPMACADSADPAVCVVELAFQVAHVVQQIHVTAHVRL